MDYTPCPIFQPQLLLQPLLHKQFPAGFDGPGKMHLSLCSEPLTSGPGALLMLRQMTPIGSHPVLPMHRPTEGEVSHSSPSGDSLEVLFISRSEDPGRWSTSCPQQWPLHSTFLYCFSLFAYFPPHPTLLLPESHSQINNLLTSSKSSIFQRTQAKLPLVKAIK